ncbi:MAG: holo-ACP synthase [Acholeplasmataceae bacterium]
MIEGIGIDIVNISRMDTLSTVALHRLFHEMEVTYALTLQEKQRSEYLAGRFAAKEAIFKAISHGDGKTNFKDITILNDLHRKPYVKTHPFGQELQFQVSISHTEKQAIAFVICERL